jgi:hypothetical protein
MSLPLTYNITLYRGDDWSQVFTFATGTSLSSTPIDLTGSTIVADIRSSENSGTVLATFTISNRLDSAGTFTMSLPDATTTTLGNGTLASGPGVFDIQVTSPGGLVTTYIKGTITMILDVTY